MSKTDKLARKARSRVRGEAVREARAREEAGLPAAPLGSGAPREIGPRVAYERRQTGLEQLHRRNKITTAQKAAGEMYGELYRADKIEGEAMIPSSLAALDSVGGGRGGGKLVKLVGAEVRAQVSAAFATLQFDALRSQASMIAACDVICGKQWTPQQVTEDRSAQLQIETTLRLALDLLATWRRQDGGGQSAAHLVAA